MNTSTVTQTESRLLLQNSSFNIIFPELAEKFGWAAAIILQTLHYWLTTLNKDIGKVHEGRRWIYNSYRAWKINIKSFSEKTIFRKIKYLEELGIIQSAYLHDYKGNRTKWYTIDYQQLSKWVGQDVQIHNKDTKITSDKTVLNCEIEVKEKETGIDTQNQSQTQTSETVPPEIIQQAQTILQEEVLSKLDEPQTINPTVFLQILPRLLKKFFGNLEEWRKYCIAVATNAFLMGKKLMKSGEKWKLFVGWILDSRNINAYIRKEKWFNVWEDIPKDEDMPKKLPPKPLPDLSLEEVIQTAKNDLDRKVKSALYQSLGEITYKSWFHITGFIAVGIKKGEPDFYINSRFTKDYVNQYFKDQLKEAFERR